MAQDKWAYDATTGLFLFRLDANSGPADARSKPLRKRPTAYQSTDSVAQNKGNVQQSAAAGPASTHVTSRAWPSNISVSAIAYTDVVLRQAFEAQDTSENHGVYPSFSPTVAVGPIFASDIRHLIPTVAPPRSHLLPATTRAARRGGLRMARPLYEQPKLCLYRRGRLFHAFRAVSAKLSLSKKTHRPLRTPANAPCFSSTANTINGSCFGVGLRSISR